MKESEKNELNQEDLENVTGGLGLIATKRYPKFPNNFSYNRHCLVETYKQPCNGALVLVQTYQLRGYDDFVCTECGQRYKHTYEGDKWEYVD